MNGAAGDGKKELSFEKKTGVQGRYQWGIGGGGKKLGGREEAKMQYCLTKPGLSDISHLIDNPCCPY